MINKSLYIIVFFFLLSTILYSQAKNDTLIFFSHFSFFPVKSIEIIDTCNSTSIFLYSKDGRFITPKFLIINQKSIIFKIIMRQYFPFNKVIRYVSIYEIKTKYIYLWRQRNNIQFDCMKRYRGIV